MSGHHTLSSAERGYGYQWRKQRAEKLTKAPYCEFTEYSNGRPCGRRATTVDHINGTDRLRSACMSCHMKHTAAKVGLGTKIGAGRANTCHTSDCREVQQQRKE